MKRSSRDQKSMLNFFVVLSFELTERYIEGAGVVYDLPWAMQHNIHIYTLPETNNSHLKSWHPKRKPDHLPSNHQFSGANWLQGGYWYHFPYVLCVCWKVWCLPLWWWCFSYPILLMRMGSLAAKGEIFLFNLVIPKNPQVYVLRELRPKNQLFRTGIGLHHKFETWKPLPKRETSETMSFHPQSRVKQDPKLRVLYGGVSYQWWVSPNKIYVGFSY